MMQKAGFLTFLFALSCILCWSFFACDQSGSDDDADDDVRDDDSSDDDAADDDVDDDVSYCDSLTEEEKNLFRVIFCAGASNSHTDDFEPLPATIDEVDEWYHGKIAAMAMTKLSECLYYEPEFWVYWYDEVRKVRDNTTISWAVDAFFHYLDDDPQPWLYRLRVLKYLDTLFNGMNEGVRFIGANVPKLMMFGYDGDRNEILRIINEEMAERPYAVMIDLNYYLEKLLQGKVYYNGEKLSFLQIMRDERHFNEFGHQVAADLFIMTINSVWQNLQIPTWGQIEILD